MARERKIIFGVLSIFISLNPFVDMPTSINRASLFEVRVASSGCPGRLREPSSSQLYGCFSWYQRMGRIVALLTCGVVATTNFYLQYAVTSIIRLAQCEVSMVLVSKSNTVQEPELKPTSQSWTSGINESSQKEPVKPHNFSPVTETIS